LIDSKTPLNFDSLDSVVPLLFASSDFKAETLVEIIASASDTLDNALSNPDGIRF